jgi:hypothetical protein
MTLEELMQSCDSIRRQAEIRRATVLSIESSHTLSGKAGQLQA